MIGPTFENNNCKRIDSLLPVCRIFHHLITLDFIQFDAENGGYSCFYLDATMRPFEEARQVCQGMGADVANLQTEWEQAFVTSYVMDTSVWLGLVLNSVKWDCFLLYDVIIK